MANRDSTATPRTVVVAGGSGLVGSALVPALRAQGFIVRRLVRRPSRADDEITWDPAAGALPVGALDGVAAVINLAGAGAGDHRWTRSYRELILSSRVSTTSLLAQRLAEAKTPDADDPSPGASPACPVLIQASATGFYGDRGDEVLTEASAPGRGFLADVVREWEAAAEPARQAGVRVVTIRSGIVLAHGGGALGKLLPLLRLGVAGPLGSGRQFWSWITLPDEVRAILHLLDADVRGPVNLTTPAPVRNRDLTHALGAAFHRPTVLPVPGFALKLVIGGFSAEILGSQRVHPDILEASGFSYEHPTIHAAATWLAG
ncbi:hypothetical protein SAMN05216410_2623 [Sanguibacter gelidistatuariae]|uniref:TIGR01777 family protein n=1 Tax=Sanguibacter gelidistatuariae TaxID=1814289 RepID=A0A1G6R8Z2_9MICO|nr:TIGR01777 family oxidoreductase [Sanguibacter gelidistatuariae]SDD00754.1 hypothetical protein SAMN05216410_2623 [Sanguibacter gelidistatuariae]